MQGAGKNIIDSGDRTECAEAGTGEAMYEVKHTRLWFPASSGELFRGHDKHMFHMEGVYAQQPEDYALRIAFEQ